VTPLLPAASASGALGFLTSAAGFTGAWYNKSYNQKFGLGVKQYTIQHRQVLKE
jgi:hypothetical protein